MHDENELPVLSAIVRNGNESIIQSTRFGREVLDELEALRRASEAGTQQPAAVAFDLLPGLGDGSVVHLLAESDEQPAAASPVKTASSTTAPGERHEALERRVEQIIERHVDALRREVQELLARAR